MKRVRHSLALKIWLTKRKGSPCWVIRYVDPQTGSTQQRSTFTSNKKEAERQLGELRSDIINHRYVGKDDTLWNMFREKFETEVLPGLALQTRTKSDTVLDAVERIIKPSKLSDLTASRISQFAAALRDGTRSESTIASYLAHLKASLNWAANMNLIHAAPKIQRPKRAKSYKKPKGRAPSDAEFQRMLQSVTKVVGDTRAPSWRHLLEGLWWSGLRLAESLDLYWDREDKLHIDFSSGHPLLSIPAELEKGHQDRLLPVAPEFAEMLGKTPDTERHGRVFNPTAKREKGPALFLNQISKVITAIGKAAEVVVYANPITKKVKYASAHDLRRAFGDRWALRVMPPVLMQMMRHESIETTMRFYVGRSAEATSEAIWDAYRKAQSPGNEKRDSLRDSDNNSETPKR